MISLMMLLKFKLDVATICGYDLWVGEYPHYSCGNFLGSLLMIASNRSKNLFDGLGEFIWYIKIIAPRVGELRMHFHSLCR